MNKKLKIAIYSGMLPSSTFIESLILAVAEHYDVYIFGTKKAPLAYESSHIHIIETPTNQWKNIPLTISRLFKLLLKNPKFIAIAFKEARRYQSIYEQWMRFCRFVPVLLNRPDIFHLQWASKLDRWMFLKKAYDCKIVLSLLGSNINVDPILNKRLQDSYLLHFKDVDAFHAVSHDLARKALTYGASEERILVIKTLLSTKMNNFYNVDKKANNVLEMVSVGRHHWIKGYRYAIEAVAMLKKRGICVNYTIIAVGRVPEELLFLVHEKELQDQIIFKSAMPQDVLFNALEQFDLLVLPSLSEGIANVVLEAMMLGIPVVSTDCGGMAEVVIPEQTGWLVPIANSEALGTTLMNFIDTDIDTVKEIVNNAFTLVIEEFNQEKVIRQYLALYESLYMHLKVK